MSPISLTGFSNESREASFIEAASAFSVALGFPADERPLPANIADQMYSSPLTLHMAALAAVLSSSENAEQPIDISRYLLLHEQRRWNSLSDVGTVRTLVMLATLFGPMHTRETARELILAAGIADGTAEADRLLRDHHYLYPSEQHLSPLRPDRFAEDFIGWHLSRSRVVLDDLAKLLIAAPPAPSTDSLRQAMIVLANAARHPSVRDLLERVVRVRPELAEQSSEVLLAVTNHLSFPTAAIIAFRGNILVESTHARHQLIQRVVREFPSTADASVNRSKLRLLGDSFTDCGEYHEAAEIYGGLVQRLREDADAGSLEELVELADLLNRYAQAVAARGSEADALEIMNEAVDLLQVQSESDMGDLILDYKEILARSLSNRCNALAGAGNLHAALADAEEAAILFQELADDDPEVFVNVLLRSRARIAQTLHELGRFEEADKIDQGVVDALRPLYVDDPKNHRSDLAYILYNHGVSVARLGDSERAVVILAESAELYRHLAKHIPLRFLDELGRCLFTLSNALDESNRARDMVKVLREQLTVQRKLNQLAARPDNRLLAITLSELGQQLAMLGENEQARPALIEAATVAKELISSNDSAAALIASQSLISLSIVFRDLGCGNEAIGAAREAVEVSRDCGDGSDFDSDRHEFCLSLLAEMLEIFKHAAQS
ncbi:hypothetical protein B0I29_10198 [Actinoplanes lutulentus]|uniref:Anaphase-promoting complex subunit 5 domain-containing protein n=2 Tax=Actinoplanes lutulentus TaxID=1287878 RepID=A0A327ZQ63_9ACTN|nr:hypothetical protein B0I29_10198 [Actinoplanes lutulentus]